MQVVEKMCYLQMTTCCLLIWINLFYYREPYVQVGALIGAGLGRGLVEKGFRREALSFVNFRLLAGIGEYLLRRKDDIF